MLVSERRECARGVLMPPMPLLTLVELTRCVRVDGELLDSARLTLMLPPVLPLPATPPMPMPMPAPMVMPFGPVPDAVTTVVRRRPFGVNDRSRRSVGDVSRCGDGELMCAYGAMEAPTDKVGDTWMNDASIFAPEPADGDDEGDSSVPRIGDASDAYSARAYDGRRSAYC